MFKLSPLQLTVSQQRRKERNLLARKDGAARRAKKLGLFVENVDPRVLLGYHEGICGLCNKLVDFHDFHMDHIVPLAKGGEHRYRNMQPSHPACNLRKGDKFPWPLS